MNTFEKMTLPELARETALRWRLVHRSCPECQGALYKHAELGPLEMGYERCPACRLNFINLHGLRITDAPSDAMLDELARRAPIISNPVPFYARQNPVDGSLEGTPQPGAR